MRPRRSRPPQVRYTTLTVILTFLLLIGLAATAFADNYFNRGVAWGPNLPAIPNARDLNPLGVNTFLDQEVDRTNVYRSLKMIAGGGFHWVRQGFAWNDLEIGGKGVFTDTRDPAHPKSAWDKYDFIVDEANKLNLEIIARLDSAPDWARTPCDANGLPTACDDLKKYTKGPPTNYNDYGDFVYAVVSHYKGRLRYFQIWNEPNLEGEWGGKPINAADFTRLLKIAYTRAKQANPDAVILMPGLAPTDDKTYPANESDLLFLQDMYNAGAKDYFDIASVMIYGFQEPPTTHRIEFNRFNFSRPILTHEVMVKNGDGNKPIWGSEYAWLSLSPNIDWPPDPRYGNQKSMWGNGVDEQTQGDWLVGGYERARRDWPWMGVMNVWKFRDPINNPTLPASWFSIVNNDFSPRPAYNILHDYARSGARGEVAAIGVHSASSAAVIWQGNWNKSAAPVSGGKGDTLSITSIGDALRLKVNVPLHYQVSGGSGGDASPTSDGTVDIGIGSSAYSHTVTAQMLADNAQVAGFTVYRDQPVLLAAAIPAAYVISATGLGVAAYRLLPWLAYLLNALFSYLLLALAQLWAALRLLGRAFLSLLRRLAFTLIYLSLPKNTVNPATTSRYLPTRLQSTIYNLQSKIAPIGLIISVALFYLPVTRAELLKDINPWPLIIGGLLAAFFDLLVPEVGLALTLALVPLYLAPGYANIGFMEIGWGPKYIGHYYFPIAELLLLLTAAVIGWRIAVNWLVGRLAPAAWQPEDRARTMVMSALRTPLTQVVQYLRADTFALLGVLWVMLGGFSLLTVADRNYLPDSLRELRWTIIEPVLFYFLYVYVVGRTDPHPNPPPKWGGESLSPPLEAEGLPISPPISGEAGWGSVPQPKMFLLFDFFIGAAVIVSIFGIVQFFFGSNTVNVENLSRVTSVYEHPNSLALYLGRALPLTVAFAVLLPAYRQRRVIYALASAIIGITMYLTYSRGAILGIGGALVVIALLGGRGVIARMWQVQRRVVVTIGSLALIIGAAAAYFALARLTDTGSISLRRDIWSAALHMIKDHPIFGVGLDQFGNQYPHYATAAVQAVGEIYTSHPHNFLLDYWLRLGIIGLLLGGLTIFTFYRCGWWLTRLTRNPLHRAIVVALLASMTDFVLHGLVDQAYFVPDLALIFWFTLASMEATRRYVLDEK